MSASSSHFPIIVIGASLGGMEALKKLFAQLPTEFNAAVLVVWHISPESPNLLPEILQRVTALPVRAASDGELIQAGRAYIARPDHHLVIEARSTPEAAGVLRLTRAPKENRFRPSIDVLFRSAAVAFGSRVIGVILTGALDDGAAGSYAVKECGGKVIVQDPLDAECPNMPINAMRATKVDRAVPIEQMGTALVNMTSAMFEGKNGLMPEQPESSEWKAEVRIALEDSGIENGVLNLGNPSTYTCPECHGVLMKIREGNYVRFRCHTGHAFSLNTLLAEVSKSTEVALWNALRAIQESELILTHLSEHLHDTGDVEAAEACLGKVIATRRRADTLRQAAVESASLSADVLGTRQANHNNFSNKRD